MSFVALLNTYYDGLGSLKQAHFIEIGKTEERWLTQVTELVAVDPGFKASLAEKLGNGSLYHIATLL